MPPGDKYAYILTRDVVVHPYDFLNGKPADGPGRLATKGLKLDSLYIDKKDGNYVFKFWDFNNNGGQIHPKNTLQNDTATKTIVKSKEDLAQIKYTDNGYYFYLSKDEFESATQKYYQKG